MKSLNRIDLNHKGLRPNICIEILLMIRQRRERGSISRHSSCKGLPRVQSEHSYNYQGYVCICVVCSVCVHNGTGGGGGEKTRERETKKSREKKREKEKKKKRKKEKERKKRERAHGDRKGRRTYFRTTLCLWKHGPTN